MAAADPFVLRVMHGNALNPLTDPQATLAAHTLVAGLRAWESGQITKATLVAAFDLTHADDSADLDGLATAGAAARTAGLLSIWFHELEMRMILGESKENGLDGLFGFAVKSTFLQGADGAHNLRSEAGVPVGERFTTWASA